MTAGSTSPLQAAVIGVEDLERSLAVYRDIVGLEVIEHRVWSGAAFEQLWSLPAGSSAQTAVLADRGNPIGRLMLMQFDAQDRKRVRDEKDGLRTVGLVNLNFYAADIEASTNALEAAGYRPWSRPTSHDMGPEVGAPTEVMIDGPDTVIINLLQHGGDPKTRSGSMGVYMRDVAGYTPTGMTPVVTTAHNVADIDKGIAFYEQVLGLKAVINIVASGEDSTTFMDLPEGSRSHVVILQGEDRFGKVCIQAGLNYESVDTTSQAVAPNIGYIAQAFVVPDLDATLAKAASLGASAYSGPLDIDIPGLGPSRTAIVRNPASGALQQFIQG